MTIVMGLDQHRAQITAEWLDTETGEITRSRITPAHRQGVRRFWEKFRGQELEVALEATTGWRFVADELTQVGAVVHLAEPAETAARRGNKKRAKSDRADARHIRELLTIGRLPESWPDRKPSSVEGEARSGSWQRDSAAGAGRGDRVVAVALVRTGLVGRIALKKAIVPQPALSAVRPIGLGGGCWFAGRIQRHTVLRRRRCC
jgi:hypothetical protein